MVRVNAGFFIRYKAALNDRMKDAIMSLEGVSACAGIKENQDAADKARINHHGSFSRKIPARPFVDRATYDIGDLKLATEFRELIKSRISAPRAESRRIVRYKTYVGTERVYEQHDRMAAFGTGGGYQRTPGRIMGVLAQRMAANQRKIINARAYTGENNNGNDPQHNTPRVIARKGKDFPLKDTGEMYSEITWWTE